MINIHSKWQLFIKKFKLSLINQETKNISDSSCTIYNKKNKVYKLTEYYLGKKQS